MADSNFELGKLVPFDAFPMPDVEAEPDIVVDATDQGVIASHMPAELLSTWDGYEHEGREHSVKTPECTEHHPPYVDHSRPIYTSFLFEDGIIE